MRCSPSSPHSDCTPPHKSAHSSMRHRQIFDIMKSMCKLAGGLQLEPSLMYFRDWVQKLLSCKSWKIWPLDPSRGNRAARSVLSMDPDPSKKSFLLKKKTNGRPCVIIVNDGHAISKVVSNNETLCKHQSTL